MVVNVSNLTGILMVVFFHCAFNVKSGEMTSAKHSTKILNRFLLPEIQDIDATFCEFRSIINSDKVK